MRTSKPLHDTGSTPRRSRRHAFRASLLLVAALGALGLTGCKPGYDGVCTGDDALTGVTIVIDFQGLDGNDGRAAPTIVRCSPNPEPGTARTGIEALEDAGIDIAGVGQWGLGFVCRLNDRPAIDEPLPVDGAPGYTEACQVTPPAAAYWSYWHASGTGHTWTYSNFGALNRNVTPGGFEGWSFSLNAGATSNPAPRVDPYNPATDPAAPRVSLSVNDVDRKIQLGQSAQLTWTTSNVASRTAGTTPATGGGNWSGTIAAANGSRTVTPTARGTYVYLLQVTGTNGAQTHSTATLTVE